MIRKTRLSWAVFVAGGLAGLSMGNGPLNPEPPWVNALLCAYFAWSLYWGLPAAWRHRRPVLTHLHHWITLKDQLAKWALCQSIFWTWALLFSVFGGGLYQFFQHLRVRRGAAPRRPLISVLSSSSTGSTTNRRPRS